MSLAESPPLTATLSSLNATDSLKGALKHGLCPKERFGPILLTCVSPGQRQGQSGHSRNAKEKRV